MAIEQIEEQPTRLVLLVDDDREDVNKARRVLEKAGFKVMAAESGQVALSVIGRERFELVITKVLLPDLTGIDIVRAVKSTSLDTPVIIITAATELADARNARRQGAYEYIQKPWAAEDLLTICRRALETVRLKFENLTLRDAASDATLGVAERVTFSPRPERAAMERAALVRLTQFIGHAITKASTPVLEQALGELASDEALTDVLGEALIRDATGGEWAASLLRGAQVQRGLLQQAGGALSASEVGELLGITRAAVDKRRRQGALLGLRLPSNDFVYPAAQFAKNDVIRGLPDVLRAFRMRDPWMQLDALLARDKTLGDRTAFEALTEGKVEGVKAVISSFGAQGL